MLVTSDGSTTTLKKILKNYLRIREKLINLSTKTKIVILSGKSEYL